MYVEGQVGLLGKLLRLVSHHLDLDQGHNVPRMLEDEGEGAHFFSFSSVLVLLLFI